MRALVIGGTRFIGLHAVRRLVSENWDVTLLNRGRSQVEELPGVKRLYADRRYPEQVRSALEGHSRDFDVIFDFTGYQVGNLEPIIEIFAGKIGQYVYQSTAGVYADEVVYPIVETTPWRRRIPGLAGVAAYEFEKAECEEYLCRVFEERRFPVTMLRCPVIYGPDNWMDDREGSYFYRVLRELPILIPGDGNTLLQQTYVDDLSRAHVSVIGKNQTLGQAYNISCAEAITINQFVAILENVVGKKARAIHVEPRVVPSLELRDYLFGAFSMGLPSLGDTDVVYSIQKAREHFGFSPQYELQAGLKGAFDWWIEERGPDKIEFVPGKLGHDVDLALERQLAERYG